MQKSDVELPRHRLNASMGKAVGHRCVEQRGDDTAVEYPVVPLELWTGLKSRGDCLRVQ